MRDPEDGGYVVGSECLGTLKECITNACKECALDEETTTRRLNGLKVLGPSDAATPLAVYYQVMHLTVLNRGSSLARNIQIVLSQKSFYEMWGLDDRDEPESEGETKGQIVIRELAPDESKAIKIWFNNAENTGLYRATFEGGKIPVYLGVVVRTGYNYVFEVSRRAVHIVVVFIILALVLAVFLIARRKQGRRQKKHRQSELEGAADSESLE